MLFDNEFIGNIFIHVILLFTFLTLFFYIYVSKIEINAFKNNINDYISKIVDYIVGNTDNSYLKMISKNDNILTSLINFFNVPSRYVNEHNQLLLISTISIIISLIILVTCILIALYYNCNYSLPIMKMLKENIILFVCISIIEYLFFTYVSYQYKPVNENDLLNEIIIHLQLKNKNKNN
jgi:hypothetical protein